MTNTADLRHHALNFAIMKGGTSVDVLTNAKAYYAFLSGEETGAPTVESAASDSPSEPVPPFLDLLGEVVDLFKILRSMGKPPANPDHYEFDAEVHEREAREHGGLG